MSGLLHKSQADRTTYPAIFSKARDRQKSSRIYLLAIVSVRIDFSLALASNIQPASNRFVAMELYMTSIRATSAVCHAARVYVIAFAGLVSFMPGAAAEEELSIEEQCARLDKTVWAKEELAQKYEQTIVALWDDLLNSAR